MKICRESFYLQCHESLVSQGEWLADVVSSMERQGTKLVEGTTIQVGWSILRLVKVNSNLELCEPDFSNDSYGYMSHDTSTTLRVINSQNQLLTRIRCLGVTARFDEKIILKKGCLEEARIYAERQNPKLGDSGWFIGSVDGDDARETSDLEAIQLYQLLQLRPHILSAMALPIGWMVVWNGTDIEAVLDTENRNVWQ